MNSEINIIDKAIKKLQTSHSTTIVEGLYLAREIIEYFIYGENIIQESNPKTQNY